MIKFTILLFRFRSSFGLRVRATRICTSGRNLLLTMACPPEKKKAKSEKAVPECVADVPADQVGTGLSIETFSSKPLPANVVLRLETAYSVCARVFTPSS